MSARGSIAEIAQSVRSGAQSAAALIETTLADIAARDPGFNCFRELLADDARAAAARIDARRAAGEPLGPRAGVPFGVKELFDLAGRVTLAGSILRRTAASAGADAPLVARLKAADAILVGTLNMDEFAYGFSTENSHYGPTRNPHDPLRIAGGSSGGSAAAIAAGLLSLTLGSDTNGSIRVPAALCGVFGMKPTFGRLPREGTFPFVHSFDHVGPFTRTAADLRASFGILDGRDVQYSTGGALRAGVLQGWFRTGATAEAIAAVDHVAAALPGAGPAELREAGRARSAAFCITAAEGGNLHLPDLRTRPELFDPATRARLMAGALLPANILLQAQRFRRWFQEEAHALFERFDVLLAPATPCSAPLIGQHAVEIDSKSVPVRANLGLYTQPISFIGLPVVTVPVIEPGRMPHGVQLIGAPGSDARLLDLAARLEAEGVVKSAILEGAFA